MIRRTALPATTARRETAYAATASASPLSAKVSTFFRVAMRRLAEASREHAFRTSALRWFRSTSASRRGSAVSIVVRSGAAPMASLHWGARKPWTACLAIRAISRRPVSTARKAIVSVPSACPIRARPVKKSSAHRAPTLANETTYCSRTRNALVKSGQSTVDPHALLGSVCLVGLVPTLTLRVTPIAPTATLVHVTSAMRRPQ